MYYYEGKHSIVFGDGTLDSNNQFVGKDTWIDWHLLPENRPAISMPGVETKFITIPGRDGSIDLSEFLAGKPVYGSRSGSLSFYVIHDEYHGKTYADVYSEIAQFIHGKKLKMCLTDDPRWYYEGRFTLDGWQSDPSYSKITISYQVGPFKYSVIEEGTEDIIWDTFNFETDDHWFIVFSEHTVTNVTETYSLPVTDNVYSINATCLSGTATINFNGETATLSSGENARVGHSNNVSNSLSLSGDGVVTLGFRRGSL